MTTTKGTPEIETQSLALRTSTGTAQPTFRLTITTGPDAPKSFDIDGESPARIYVGTGSTSHALLTDRTVSRRHLALSLRDGALGVEDLGSTNGTYVGSMRVKDVALSGGEELVVGGTRMRVDRLAEGAVLALGREASFGRIIGASVAMRRLYPVLRRLADSDAPVLVEGEAGTGKELVAEVLHEEGPRREGPFVVFDPSLVEPEHLERVLFGSADAPGVVEQARNGTLVLDEPTELPPRTQASFARLLEGRSITRADGTPLELQGIRVIALSRNDIEREVQANRLREDLATLLAGAHVSLPPLREREGDIALLATTFMRAQGVRDRVLPPISVRRFEAHTWPGNVRELQRAVVRFATTGNDETNPVAAFREETRPTSPTELVERVLAADLPLGQAREVIVDDFERRFVKVVLEKHGGNVTRAAAASGVARRYFQVLRAKRS